MYVRNHELGIVDPITSAIFSIGALKNLFGFGKKKRARKANVEQNTGLYTAAFPPGTDFAPMLDKTPAFTPRGKRKGAKTMRDDFDLMFARKDSWLVKNGVATPDDYAAYTLMEEVDRGAPNICDPNELNPKSKKYQRCPVINGENVFRVIAARQAAANASAAPIVKPVVPLPAEPAPGFIDKLATELQSRGFTPSPAAQQFLPGAPQIIMAPPAPAPAPVPAVPAVAAPAVPPWIWWGVPIVVLGVGGAYMMARRPAPRRRRRKR